MAETDTKVAGKTGDELRSAVLQQQAEATDRTELPEEKKVQAIQKEVKPEETLDPLTYTVPETKVSEAKEIDTGEFVGTQPVVPEVKGYEATKVGDVGKVKVKKGDLSSGSIMQAAQGTISPESLAQEVSAELDPRATTKFQLAELFKDIEDGKPLPAWAAPAVRKVSGIMSQRGLGASSMASAAMVQAVMESGLNIAVQDANKYSAIQLQNLSQKQQTTLQNATVSAQMDVANLNNRRTAEVNNAKAFLTLDLQNLTNEQQAATIDYQTQVKSYLTDAAQDNAAKQFNAKSENEIEEFFAELGSQIENQTLSRKLAIEQYNVSQKAALEQYNANLESQREIFNANARVQIDQSNAVWRRNINTANTALQNEVNRINVQTLLGLTQQSQNNLWQLYRDQATWAMGTSENNLDRAHNAAMQSAAISANANVYDEKFDNFLIVKAIDNIFS